MDLLPEKECSECGGLYPLIFFRGAITDGCINQSDWGISTICEGCENTSKDRSKARDRWKQKARDTLRRHGERLAIPKQDLEYRFGWDTTRMAHEAEHVYSNGCPYCGELLEPMGHGLADITLDIIRPDDPPYYGTNTAWICQTCNRSKGRTPPALWGAKLNAWARWRKQQTALAARPQLSLFK